jgi:hypothetical protein
VCIGATILETKSAESCVTSDLATPQCIAAIIVIKSGAASWAFHRELLGKVVEYLTGLNRKGVKFLFTFLLSDIIFLHVVFHRSS